MSESRIKVLLVDDHAIVLEGLRRVLELDKEIEVVGVARNGSEAISVATSLSPDVVVMDLKMPVMDGISATRELKKRLPNIRVLILTVLDDDSVEKAIGAGVSGYLQKNMAPKEIANAVHQVHQGLCPISPALTQGLITELATLKQKNKSLLLTPRESSILKLIAEGKNTTEIGDSLFISSSTVKREVGQIFDKLGVNDRPHAVSEAIRQNLI
ncbi:MAG: response regulator transcription factor [Dehalococcoidales bacterium]|nr:response regulator transcription factor [Dehalococcoidales bacterium]